MKILGVKEGHDGTYALLEGNKLKFSLEAEKDSFPRTADINTDLLIRAAELSGGVPDVIAVGGWTKGLFSSEPSTFSGYFGSSDSYIQVYEKSIFGKKIPIFSSTHERSHIWCAYGLSPFPQGQACYVLVWEGNVGNFYFIDNHLTVTDLGRVLEDPGNKYTFLFSLADKKSPNEVGFYDIGHPGKMMALAAYGTKDVATADENKLIETLISTPQFKLMNSLSKEDFKWSPFFNIGVESQEFKNIARRLSDRIFDIFHQFASKNLTRGLPLLIAGGCGLNCEWNSQWRESGIFSDVFVPPCTNDSGSAVGTALDAQRHFTGNAKVEWSVYSGEVFVWDCGTTDSNYTEVNWNSEKLARKIANGSVVAWVEGRYEMGPRALGHRSLLAEPFQLKSRDLLNSIKNRESYRPIAPICLEEKIGQHFTPDLASPHMLHFYKVTDNRLQAITHVDGSARVQTLEATEAPLLAELLREIERELGCAVLCNTSLNYHGRGFINRMSDLIKYCTDAMIDGFVVDGKKYWSKDKL